MKFLCTHNHLKRHDETLVINLKDSLYVETIDDSKVTALVYANTVWKNTKSMPENVWVYGNNRKIPTLEWFMRDENNVYTKVNTHDYLYLMGVYDKFGQITYSGVIYYTATKLIAEVVKDTLRYFYNELNPGEKTYHVHVQNTDRYSCLHFISQYIVVSTTKVITELTAEEVNDN